MRLFSVVVAGLASFGSAFPFSGRFQSRDTADSIAKRASGQNYPPHTFNQAIDHFPQSPRYEPHDKNTFKQRYFFDKSYYKPGGPVFLYIGGETSGESRFENLQTGIIQILMQEFNGLGVILENRYYGESYPYKTSTTDQLAYLTTEQTIADIANFAQHAKFEGINEDLSAPKRPWILYGGSLAGAQTAFAVKTYPHILFGGISSSGTTKAVLAYPEWYKPIQKFGPSDCIASINAIVDKIDKVIDSKDSKAIKEMKGVFGLQDLSDIRDFAMTIAFPLGGPFDYPDGTWQELNWYPEYSSNDFYNFCSNVTNLDAPESVTQVDHKLAKYTGGEPWINLGSYAAYFKKVILSTCSTGKVDTSDCFSTQNKSYWADITNSGTRSYLYSTCTEQGAYQVAPASGPSLISRVLKVDYTQQWCDWAYPPGKHNKIPKTPDLGQYNKYGGYDVIADRLAHIDGDYDVWKDLCFHSDDAPPRQSSDLRPEYLIAGGGHHRDSYGIKNIAAEPQNIQQAHLWEIRTIKRWLKAGVYYPSV